jgi:hypothetical protein
MGFSPEAAFNFKGEGFNSVCWVVMVVVECMCGGRGC